MHIDGNWFLADDGVIRPVIRAEVLAGDGSWHQVPLLVDTGADCTTLSAAVLHTLGLPSVQGKGRLAGVGGKAGYVIVAAKLRFTTTDNRKVDFGGQLRAAADAETLDMSLLGRDITNIFTVIIDRPQDVVCLLGQRHSYTIVES